jgi:aerobic C4-dicarboxylate transport protein
VKTRAFFVSTTIEILGIFPFVLPNSPKPEKRSHLYGVLTNLTFWVMIALIAGISLGHFKPETAVRMEDIGKGFISIIKVFIYPIIFLTIVLGISSMGDLKKVGRIGIKSLIYFEVVTTLALGIGIGVAYVLKPGRIDKTDLSVQDPTKYTMPGSGSFDWAGFFAANPTLYVLLAAILTGILINYAKSRERMIAFLSKASALVFTLLKYVMYLAPLGAFGGIAYTVGKFGLHTLVPLAKLMSAVYLTMLVFIVGVLGLILRYYKLNIFSFLRYIRDELLLVLGTSSSESALPSLMHKLEKMGCSKSIVGLVIPAGYSFNLDGTSIYLSMAIIFLSQLYGVHLTPAEIFTIIGILMITSKGAAGVTGSGFIVLASTLTAIHRIPVEGLAFLLGVDKFMSEARAITNLIGNGVAAIVIAKSEKEFIDPAEPEFDAVEYDALADVPIGSKY